MSLDAVARLGRGVRITDHIPDTDGVASLTSVKVKERRDSRLRLPGLSRSATLGWSGSVCQW